MLQTQTTTSTSRAALYDLDRLAERSSDELDALYRAARVSP